MAKPRRSDVVGEFSKARGLHTDEGTTTEELMRETGCTWYEADAWLRGQSARGLIERCGKKAGTRRDGMRCWKPAYRLVSKGKKGGGA